MDYLLERIPDDCYIELHRELNVGQFKRDTNYILKLYRKSTYGGNTSYVQVLGQLESTHWEGLIYEACGKLNEWL